MAEITELMKSVRSLGKYQDSAKELDVLQFTIATSRASNSVRIIARCCLTRESGLDSTGCDIVVVLGRDLTIIKMR